MARNAEWASRLALGLRIPLARMRKSRPNLSGELRQGDGDRGDGGGLSTQDRRAKGRRNPSLFSEELQLIFGPATLRADCEENIVSALVGSHNITKQGFGLSFRENDAEPTREARGLAQLHGFSDFGRSGPARLLGGLKRNSAPTFSPLRGRRSQVRLRAASDHWNDPLHAEFGTFFDRPFHPVELEHG